MTKCVEGTNPASYGFASEQDILKLDRLLDMYKKAMGDDYAKHAMFRAMAIDAVAKVEMDAKTTNIAIANTNASMIEAEKILGKKQDVVDHWLTIIGSTRSNLALSFINNNMTEPLTGMKRFPKEFRENAKKLQAYNPLNIAKGWEKQLKQEGSLARANLNLKVKYNDIMQSGRFGFQVLLSDAKHGDIIDRAYLEAIHSTWDAVKGEIKLQKNGKYKVVESETLRGLVEDSLKKNANFDLSNEMAREILVKLTSGYFKQLNTYLTNFQSLGVRIEWNDNYVMPNYHDKNVLVFQKITQFANDAIEKAIKEGKPLSPEFTAKAIEDGIEDVAKMLMRYGDDMKVLGKEFIEKYGNTSKYEKYRLDRYKNIARAMYQSELQPQIKDELGQAGEIGLQLSSINRRLAQRKYYFKDAQNYFDYLYENNPRFDSAYKKGNAQGVLVAEMLEGDISTISKDLTMVQLFGTNPALTLRKMSPDDLGGAKNNNRAMLLDLISHTERGVSLKQMLFPQDFNQILDIDAEVQNTFLNILKNPLVDATDFKKRFANQYYGTGGESKALNAYEFEKGYLGLITQLPKELLSPILFLSNVVHDTFQTAFNIAQIRTGVQGVAEGIGYTGNMFTTAFRFISGGIAQQDISTRVKPLIAQALNVKIEDITSENMADTLEMLGAMRDLGSIFDLHSSIAKKDKTQNRVLYNLRKINASKFIASLGGIPLNWQTFMKTGLTSIHTHKILKRLIDPSAKMSPVLEVHMQSYGLERPDMAMIDDLFGNALSSKQLGVMDLDALQIGVGKDMTEARLENAITARYGDKAKTKIGEVKQVIDKMLEPYYEQKRINYNAQMKAEGKVGYKTLGEFMNNLPSDLKANKQKMRDKISQQYIDKKAKAFTYFVENLKDESSYILNDSGALNQMMKSSHPRDKMLTATFLHLKQFIFQFAEVERMRIERIKEAYPDNAGIHLAGTYGSYLAVMGASGALYSMIQGALSNEQEGLYAIGSSIIDPDLTNEEKTARILGELAQSVQMGLPIGSVLKTVINTVGGKDSVLEGMLSMILSPLPVIATGTLEKNRSWIATYLTNTDDMSYSQEEAFNERQKEKFLTALNTNLRLLPAVNLPITKALLNYGTEPLLRDAFDMMQDSAKYEEMIEDMQDIGTLEKGLEFAGQYRGKPIIE